MKQDKTFDYGGSDGAAYHEGRKVPGIAENWIAKVRSEKIQPFIKPTDSVLEYGVGFGWNLRQLLCFRKVGFDVAAGLKNASEAHRIAFVDDVDLIPTESFDVVLCHHTLEHLKDPAEALRTILRVLKPEGSLLLFVPFEKERKYRKYNPNDRAHHLFSWTPASLANFAQAVGFEVRSVQLRKFRFDRAAALLAIKLKLGEKFYRFVRAAALMLMPEYEIQLIASKVATS